MAETVQTLNLFPTPVWAIQLEPEAAGRINRDAMARLEAADVPVERGVDHLGRARGYARDPFGNRLEFIESVAG